MSTSSRGLYGYAGAIEGIEQAARLAGLTTTITVLDQQDPEERRPASGRGLCSPSTASTLGTREAQANAAARRST